MNRLADMTVDLGEMFQKHGYEDASCFGHALEGNLHLVFSQAHFCCEPCYVITIRTARWILATSSEFLAFSDGCC